MKHNKQFKEAVELTPDIANGYKVGLQALGGDTSKVIASQPQLLNGSVDIDSQTANKYHDANRWDYAIGYDSKVYFAEIHPAYTSEVQRVIQKLRWLKSWLITKAPLLNGITHGMPTYAWIQSGKGGILPGSKQAKLAAMNGIKPIKQLVLK